MIIFCFEKDRSGETIALNQIASVLAVKKGLQVKSFLANTFTNTDPFYLGGWVWTSIIFWLKTIARQRKVEWVFVSTYTAGFAACLLKPLMKYKLCFYYFGNRIPPRYIRDTRKRKAVNFMLYWFIVVSHQIVIFLSDRIIAPSGETLEDLFKQLHMKKYSNKTYVIPNGVDLKIFRPVPANDSQQIRDIYKVSGKRVILYAGRLHPQKSVLELVRATHILSKEFTDIHLMILHSPSFIEEEIFYKKELLKAVDRLKFSNVTFLISNHDDLSGYFNIAEVTVLPSKKDDFPLAALESLASGCICVSTARSGLNEVLKEIDPKLIIKNSNPQNIASALRYVLSLNQSEKIQLKKKGINEAKKYSWNKSADRIAQYL